MGMAAAQALLLIDLQAAFVTGDRAVPGAEALLGSAQRLLSGARDGFLGTDLGSILVAHRVSRVVIAGVMSEMCVSATARTALDRGYLVVLPHDAHGTYDIPAGPGFDQDVPAAVAARVAEWSLGDQMELVTGSDEVSFEPAYSASEM